MKKCIICKKSYTGRGNNAEPVKRGRCCDACNSGVVIPIRMAKVVRRKTEETKIIN